MTAFDRYDRVRALRWHGDRLTLLDQRVLPAEVSYVDATRAIDVAKAIALLQVRGAPAIGIAAAYGVVLAAREIDAAGRSVNRTLLGPAFDALAASRPTAVNLHNALARMGLVIDGMSNTDDNAARIVRLDDAARSIEAEDLAANRAMGALGAGLIAPGSGVLTHCNTGSLATAGFGTALGVIRAAYAEGRVREAFATETRPWMQGSRLTIWELMQDGIPARLIADSAGAHLMATGHVTWLIVGADRITANGDTANKIGTRQLAIAARYHGLRTMVVAPSTTVDLGSADGAAIEIELRDAREITELGGRAFAAPGATGWNPVFDVTPAELIDALVTERGVILKPDRASLAAAFGRET